MEYTNLCPSNYYTTPDNVMRDDDSGNTYSNYSTYVGGEYVIETEMISLPPHAYSSDSTPSPSYHTTNSQADVENQNDQFGQSNKGVEAGKPWIPKKKKPLTTTLKHHSLYEKITRRSSVFATLFASWMPYALVFFGLLVFLAIFVIAPKIISWHKKTFTTINIATTPSWETISAHNNIDEDHFRYAPETAPGFISLNITPSTTVTTLVTTHLSTALNKDFMPPFDVYAFPDNFRFQDFHSMLGNVSTEITADYLRHLDVKLYNKFHMRKMTGREYINHRVGRYESLKDDKGLQLLVKPRERKFDTNTEYTVVKKPKISTTWFDPINILDWFTIDDYKNSEGNKKTSHEKGKEKNRIVAPVNVLTPTDIKEWEQQREIDKAARVSKENRFGRRGILQLVPFINATMARNH